ncbi:MAG: glycosyltransferase family 2 protein [Planctomycetaceae bacterium]
MNDGPANIQTQGTLPDISDPDDSRVAAAGEYRATSLRDGARFTDSPFITVVVPVRNEERFIQQTLMQLLTQEYDSNRFEVIVADGESTDRTGDIVRKLQASFPQLKLVNNPRRWSSSGRNAAIKVGQGDIFLIVDGHCQIDNPRYLHNLSQAFSDADVDCVGRPQPLDIGDANRVQRAIAAARSCRLGHHPSSFIYSDEERFVPPHSVAVAYRKAVFDRVGLFDEAFDACEDVEFNHRVAAAGFRCWLTPKASVHYVPRGTLGGLFRQLVRYGRGRMRLLRKDRSTFSLGSSIPALFVAGIVVGALLAPLHAAFAWTYFSILGLYAAIVTALSVILAVRERNASLIVLGPLVLLTIHIASGWGYLREWLSPGGSRT